MMNLMTEAHPCDVATEPNRQGHLILGPCVSPSVPVLGDCPTGPPDPDFGVLPCKCLKSSFRIFTVDSGTTPLAPHDLVRVKVTLRNICSL